MDLLRLVAVFLSIYPTLAIPPESFGFPSAPNDTMLSVTFSGDIMITEAELLGIDGMQLQLSSFQILTSPALPAQQPQLAVNPAMYRSISSYKGQYMALMVDPDASTPQNPTSRFILHWAQPNLTSDTMGMLMNTSGPFVPYTRPAPPPTSDPHRYILYAFQQPSNFTIPPAFSKYNAMNRTGFNLTQFISQASLGQPAAANYFFVENKTQVPATFTAPAGSSYPGGNGGAVTDGPGPSIKPSATAGSSSSASSAASATGASASASQTGAASKADVANGVNVALAAVGAYAFWAL